jgi:hypothetical protein
MSDQFSLHPTSQAELDDLEVRAIDWIKDKLQEARAHVPQLANVMNLADSQDLNTEDAYALVAYRLLVDMLNITQAELVRAQNAVNDPRIITNEPGLIICSRPD